MILYFHINDDEIDDDNDAVAKHDTSIATMLIATMITIIAIRTIAMLMFARSEDSEQRQ